MKLLRQRHKAVVRPPDVPDRAFGQPVVWVLLTAKAEFVGAVGSSGHLQVASVKLEVLGLQGSGVSHGMVASICPAAGHENSY